jgi:hypothetical protein
MRLKQFEGKSSLVRHRSRWKGNIKMGVREMGLESVEWIHLSDDKDRV